MSSYSVTACRIAPPVSAGIERKNESLVTVTRSRSRSRPADIVAPERETPGIRARHWVMPMISVSRCVTSSSCALLGRGLVGEPHHRAPQDQRPADEPEAAQRRLDLVLEGEADDPDRERAEQRSRRRSGSRGRSRLVGVARPAKKAERIATRSLPEVEDRGEHGADLDDRRERGDVRGVDLEAEQLLDDGQMAGAGDRQELGEALDRAEQDGFQDGQSRARLDEESQSGQNHSSR